MAHNKHRVGKKPGPKRGYVRPEKVKDLQAKMDAFREEQAAERARAPRELAHTCEFCIHAECEHGIQREVCVLDGVPDATGGCERWEPRYRTGIECE